MKALGPAKTVLSLAIFLGAGSANPASVYIPGKGSRPGNAVLWDARRPPLWVFPCLSEDEHRFLRFCRQLEDPRAYDPSRHWFEQRVSPYVLLVPVSDQLKDGLARMMGRRRYTVETMLGKPPEVLTYKWGPGRDS